MWDFTTKAVMELITDNNPYFLSGVADGMWKFVLERRPEFSVYGEDTVEHSEPYGVMLLSDVERFRAEPELSKYFAFDYPMKQMALRVEYCRETADFSDSMTQILTAMRNLPGKPFGPLDCSSAYIKLTNGVSQEKYIFPLSLASIFGVVREWYVINQYYETEDGDLRIAVPELPDKSSGLLRITAPGVLPSEMEVVDQTYQHFLTEKGNSPLTMGDKGRCGIVSEDFFDLMVKSEARCPQPSTVSFGTLDEAGRPYPGIVRVFHFKLPFVQENYKHDDGSKWRWMTLEEVRTALVSGKFMLDSLLMMLDFLHRRDMLGISMSGEQKKAMEDALHPLKDIQPAFAGAFPDVSMFENEPNS
ncbi:hypothetical protein F5144DRAFT_637342 [Chaetomium tenue]|uniref:Uncharacterized protein n=1 Tax=Chaetomium tenue TaxID=1854479 RepID=A0ACB7PNZ0_9PEZI|nr:hypothetical protein F5144DRAFT_637342 [Chaetomium globosum]